LLLRAGALRAITAELDRSEGIPGSHETGGTLYGRVRRGVVELLDASGSGSDGRSRRFEDNVMVSVTEAHAFAEELRRIW
jgi:hypothetical protein